MRLHGSYSEVEAILNLMWVISLSAWALLQACRTGCLLFAWGGCGGRAVCSRGSTVGECRACGVRALASCTLQSQGDTLAVFCGCVNAGVLAELVQSKLECSEKPFRLCSIPQLCAETGMHAAVFSPLHPKLLCCSRFHSCTRRSAAFECLWEMKDEVWGANGWSRVQGRKQEEILSCSFKPSPGQ